MNSCSGWKVHLPTSHKANTKRLSMKSFGSNARLCARVRMWIERLSKKPSALTSFKVWWSVPAESIEGKETCFASSWENIISMIWTKNCPLLHRCYENLKWIIRLQPIFRAFGSLSRCVRVPTHPTRHRRQVMVVHESSRRVQKAIHFSVDISL